VRWDDGLVKPHPRRSAAVNPVPRMAKLGRSFKRVEIILAQASMNWA
jgi:hypothetical protein